MSGLQEIRDPLHVFVRLEPEERAVLDSRPFQRLRHIHQLAMTFEVYPAATHRRFEHSLGVLELATRIFDTVTDARNLKHDAARDVIPKDQLRFQYWRRVLRMAALCHDIGHLPFSHAAEKQLLPSGWDHERLSVELIFSDEMQSIWSAMEPPIKPEHVALIAVGAVEGGGAVSPWQAILSEIITGNVFGADRMDYLLRDSHHVGVAYGRFDHFRLIDTLRILPPPPTKDDPDAASTEPTLGIEEGGRESAEALLLARYSMFSQVYLHRTRRIYDIHLADFLVEWLEQEGYGGRFPTAVDDHLALTDNEVLAAIGKALRGPAGKLRSVASRVIERSARYTAVYQPAPDDLAQNVDAGKQVAAALARTFGNDAIRHDRYAKVDVPFDFSVRRRDGTIVSSTSVSDLLGSIPAARTESVFIDRRYKGDAERWLAQHREAVIQPATEEEGDEPPDGGPTSRSERAPTGTAGLPERPSNSSP